jgi:hypothetical protein
MKFTYFFEIVLESLGLSHLHNRHLQELVCVLRMLDYCLHNKGVSFEPINEGCLSAYINLS